MLNLKLLPKNSMFLCGLAAITTSLALLSWLNVRPLSLGFLLLFMYWFYKTRCNICIEMSSEFQVQSQKTLEQLKNWKETKPAAFCIITSICLAVLAIIGHFISGSIVVLIGLAIAALLSTKYNFQFVPKADIKDFTNWPKKSIKEFEVEDEFMPEVNETNFIVLESAADSWSSKSYDKIENRNIDTDDNGEESDEIPSELLLPPEELPEIHDIDNSSDDDNEQNDSLSLPAADLFKYAIDQENSSSSSSSGSAILKANDNYNGPQLIDDGIQFKKGYFKKDSTLSTLSSATSTSSSEESLSKDLQFPDHSTLLATAIPILSAQQQQGQQQYTSKAQAESLICHNSKLPLPSFVSDIMHGLLGATTNPISVVTSVDKRQQSETKVNNQTGDSTSSDESDFELINNSDLN